MVFLAWEIISRTLAVQLANTEPETALDWDRGNSDALVALAEKTAGEPHPDLAKIRSLAVQALRANPLSARAMVDLAAVSETEGDAAKAEALMRAAGARDLRDPRAQGWLANDALKKGDFDAALPHLDALLRTHPEVAPRLLPVIAQTMQFPKSAKSLADLMQTNPPWRQAFMDVMASTASASAASSFYALLKSGPHPPTDEEIKPFILHLVKDSKFKEAYTIWKAALPADQRGDDALLYNASFGLPMDGSAFNWQLVQGLGANITISPNPGDTGPDVSVDFSGARVDFANLSHLLVLPPGEYQLSGEEQAMNFRAERGVWWRIFCLSSNTNTLGQSDLFATSRLWGRFSFHFDVPASGCEAQKLILEIPVRSNLDRVISGILNFRHLAVSQVSANTNPLHVPK